MIYTSRLVTDIHWMSGTSLLARSARHVAFLASRTVSSRVPLQLVETPAHHPQSTSDDYAIVAIRGRGAS
eukprot:5468358-Pleurochrysis_carterae.AAC.1